MADQKKVPTKVRLYRFSNKLREKAAGLGGEKAEISEEALALAEAALADMSEDYPDWVLTLIAKLAEQHGRCVDTPEDRKDHFVAISLVAHDMKGQGGTFGYPLISAFSDSLYDFTTSKADYSDNQVEIIKAHVDAMRAVIKGRVKGDGGEIGQQLQDSLEKAIAKYLPAEGGGA